MGVERIAGFRPMASTMRVHFTFVPDGSGADGTNKKARPKKISPEDQKKAAEARKNRILAEKQAEYEKLVQKARQEYELKKTTEANLKEKIQDACSEEIKAYREASTNLETYENSLYEIHYADAKKEAIENITKTRTGADRDDYLAHIEKLKPSEFTFNFTEEETKLRDHYQNIVTAARLVLSKKVSAVVGTPVEDAYVFNYISSLTYKMPESTPPTDSTTAVKP